MKNSLVFQKGYSINYIPRRCHQYGRGFGSVFSGLARFFKPLLVKGLKAVGREVLNAGSDVLTNVDKEPLNNLIKTRSEAAFKNLKRKAVENLEPLMKGKGKRKKNKTKRLKKSVYIGRGFGSLNQNSRKTKKRQCDNLKRSSRLLAA